MGLTKARGASPGTAHWLSTALLGQAQARTANCSWLHSQVKPQVVSYFCRRLTGPGDLPTSYGIRLERPSDRINDQHRPFLCSIIRPQAKVKDCSSLPTSRDRLTCNSQCRPSRKDSLLASWMLLSRSKVVDCCLVCQVLLPTACPSNTTTSKVIFKLARVMGC